MSTLFCLVERFNHHTSHTFRPAVYFSSSTLFKTLSDSREADKAMLNTSANVFTREDIKKLRVNFQPAQSEDTVIPKFAEVENFPKQYICPKISKTMLKAGNISEISDKKVRTFFNKLNIVAIGSPGMPYSRTDSLISDLLHVVELNDWPLQVDQHLPRKLHILSNPYVETIPGFVVSKERATIVIADDKHLLNIDPLQNFGETQIAAEILACGDENRRELDTVVITDQTMFAVRVISTYVTFYKTEIPAGYWVELTKGLPQEHSVVINRWPGENNRRSGLDLPHPNGREAVLTALIKIRQYFLLY